MKNKTAFALLGAVAALGGVMTTDGFGGGSGEPTRAPKGSKNCRGGYDPGGHRLRRGGSARKRASRKATAWRRKR